MLNCSNVIADKTDKSGAFSKNNAGSDCLSEGGNRTKQRSDIAESFLIFHEHPVLQFTSTLIQMVLMGFGCSLCK